MQTILDWHFVFLFFSFSSAILFISDSNVFSRLISLKSVYISIIPWLNSILRSWENLHLSPSAQNPALKFWHKIVFASWPSGTSCCFAAVTCLYKEFKNASSWRAFLFSAFSAAFYMMWSWEARKRLPIFFRLFCLFQFL